MLSSLLQDNIGTLKLELALNTGSEMSAGTLYTFSGSGNSYKIRLLEALINIKLGHNELDFLVRLLAPRI